MPFSQTLKSTADWYVQLLAESLGKKYHRKIENHDGLESWLNDKDNLFNQGPTPIAASGTNDLHSIQQNNVEGEDNKVVTFIRVQEFKTDLKVPAKEIAFLAGKSFSQLMQIAQALVKFGRHYSDDMPAELLDLAKKATMLLRRIHDRGNDMSIPAQAAE